MEHAEDLASSSAASGRIINDGSSLAELAASSSSSRGVQTGSSSLGIQRGSASSSTAHRRESSPAETVAVSRRSPRSTPRRKAKRDVTHAVMDVDGTLNLANLPAFPIAESQDSVLPLPLLRRRTHRLLKIRMVPKSTFPQVRNLRWPQWCRII